jgi:hypothetical protein
VPHHLTLCSSICVPVVVFQQSCFSIYVSACFTFVLQHLCSLPTVVFQHSWSNSRVSASTFQPVSLLCCSICVRFQQSCFSIRGPTVVFQHLRFNMFHFCVAASVFASNSRVSAFVVQQSCFSIYVSTCFTFVLQHLCSLSNNLDSAFVRPFSRVISLSYETLGIANTENHISLTDQIGKNLQWVWHYF